MKIKKSFLIATFWLTLAGFGSAMMVLTGFYLYLSPKLPSVESIREVPLETPLRIFTADGKLIGEFGERRRYPISFEQIPEDFIHALISAEDDDFYEHNGVSIKGLLRAASQLILTGRKGSGGSTLTMQLTRHIFLSLKRTYSRKFNEILLALRIEKELSKEEILELYVNYMFMGKRAYGIEAAAEVYYGKSIGQLTLAQHAMLVGVFKGPSTLNPINNPTRALQRRDYVLRRMLKLEYINKVRYDAAVAEPVSASYHGYKKEVDAPYVAEMARQKALDLFGQSAYSEGYQIHTTINSTLQNRAIKSVVKGLLAYDWRHGYRGPEQQFDLANAPQIETEPKEAGTPPGPDLPTRNYDTWLSDLKNIPEYGNLYPAVVVNTREQDITVLTRDEAFITIAWENGLSSARPYISEDSRGPKPKTAADVAAIGDLVRIKRIDDNWHFSQLPKAESSLVALNPADGAIVSLVGGFDFQHSNFNRAIQAQRQPGSNFKPFIYTAALEHGLTAATLLNDAPIVIADKQLESTWRPENSSGKFYGPTRLREALINSRNLVSIRVLNRVGVRNAIASLEKFGFDPSTLSRDLSLALGTHAVTPLDVATGYAIFANGGYRVAPYLVSRIENIDGDIVYTAMPDTVCKPCEEEAQAISAANEHDSPNAQALTPPSLTEEETSLSADYSIKGDIFHISAHTKAILGLTEPGDYPRAQKVISDQVAFIIDSILKDVVRRGTGYKAWKKFQRTDIGGKTGTTNGPIDSWFTGYHPNVVATTWVGFDQNLLLGQREFGGTAALPIWIDFMEAALANQPVINPVQPAGIVSVRINPETGKRAKIGDPDAIFEIFRDEYVPEADEDPNVNPWDSEESINEELF